MGDSAEAFGGYADRLQEAASRADTHLVPWKYSYYLSSPSCRRTRLLALSRTDYHCERCGFHGTDAEPNVHHRSYAQLGHEAPEDLEVLCLRCHAREHGKPPRC